MLNKFALFICVILLSISSIAQEATNANSSEITDFAKDEKILNEKLQDALSQMLLNDRVQQNSDFIPALVEVLKKENSFDYPFDSIDNFSTLYSPDKRFRIFTWAVPLSDTLPQYKKSYKAEQFGYRYFGAIQINNPQKLQLIPLLDRSPEMFGPEELVLSNDNWYGAVYYNIVMNEHMGRTYYTLFGWDGNNNLTSTIKVADVVYFQEDKAIFGAPIFEFRRDGFYLKRNRFILEFKKRTGVTLNYNPEKEMIIYDYIEPESPEAKGNYHLYVPDGTYEGLKFEDGMWKYQEKAFTEVSSAPLQLFDEKGSDSNKTQNSSSINNNANNRKTSNNKKKKKGFFKRFKNN